MRIGSKEIGPHQPPYIIAEMSANHQGDFRRAMAIIEQAAWAECDAVKIQLYDPLRLATARGGPDKRLTDGIWKGRTLLDIYTEGALHYDWLPTLVQHAKDCDIDLFASVFDETALAVSEHYSLPAIKISSFDCTNFKLIRAAAATRRPLIISTGMASIEDAALACAAAAGTPRAVLHCVSQYPCPMGRADLGRIEELHYYLQLPVGFSDHTDGITAACAAVAKGACIIEKHMTLDENDEGLDAAFSITSREMSDLVYVCRGAWLACRPSVLADNDDAAVIEEMKSLRVKGA